MFKKLFPMLLCAVLLAVVWLSFFIHSLSIDPDSGDLQGHIEFIWSGTPPYQPTEAEKARIDGQKHWIIRVLQKLTDTHGDRPYLAEFPAFGDKSHPAIIVLPGGAYLLRSEGTEGVDIARWLNSIGISAFVLHYRLDRHPAPLSDAQRAIQYLQANSKRLRIDPARIGVMGFSAGGHLAATAATQFLAADEASPDPVERFSSRPALVVLAYPVISFGEVGHATSRDMLIGPDPSPALVKLLSAENNVTADTPPTFIWAAKTDSIVDYRNSQLFADALAQHGVEHEYHLFPQGQHGSGLAKSEKYSREWPTLCEKWLERIGFIDGSDNKPQT
jgi:acetyl esterase/lipase